MPGQLGLSVLFPGQGTDGRPATGGGHIASRVPPPCGECRVAGRQFCDPALAALWLPVKLSVPRHATPHPTCGPSGACVGCPQVLGLPFVGPRSLAADGAISPVGINGAAATSASGNHGGSRSVPPEHAHERPHHQPDEQPPEREPKPTMPSKELRSAVHVGFTSCQGDWIACLDGPQRLRLPPSTQALEERDVRRA